MKHLLRSRGAGILRPLSRIILAGLKGHLSGNDPRLYGTRKAIDVRADVPAAKNHGCIESVSKERGSCISAFTIVRVEAQYL